MSKDPDLLGKTDDEIDLLELLRRFWNALCRMFRSIGRWTLISIVFLFRNWLPLGLSVILGVGASYLLKFTLDPFYTSDLVLRTNTLPAADMIEYIDRLHTYCEEDNQAALMGAISLSEDQVKNIIDINSCWIIDRGRDGIPDIVDIKDKHNIYDTLNIRMQDRLNIRVKVIVPQVLINVRDGIIRYIDSDSLFQQRNRIRLKQSQELATRYGYDILQLDSLQKIKYFEETQRLSQPGDGQMVFLQEQKTQLVYSDIYGLFEKRQILDADLTLYEDIVTILSDFSKPAKRKNGGTYYGKVVIPLFFCLTLIVLILLNNRKKLQEVFLNYRV